MLKHSPKFWVSWLAAGIGWESAALYYKHPEATLSFACKLIARVHTKPGAVAFVAGWAALTAWFLPHILKQIEETSA